MNSLTYLFGWISGNFSVIVFAYFFVPETIKSEVHVKNTFSIFPIILLILFLIMTLYELYKFLKGRKTKVKSPKWFTLIVETTPFVTFIISAFIASVNFKNTILLVNTGVSLIDNADIFLIIILFLIIVSLPIIILISIYFLSYKYSKSTLNRLKSFLIKYNSLILSIIFLFLTLRQFLNII